MRGAVHGHCFGLVSPTTWELSATPIDNVWSLTQGSGTNADKSKNCDCCKTVLGLFARLSGFEDLFNDDLLSSLTAAAVTLASNIPWSTPQPSAKPVATSLHPQEMTSHFHAPGKPRDTSKGLGLLSDCASPPTLSKIQKAQMGLSVSAMGMDPSSNKLTVTGHGTPTY